jgi:hypothetical protein
MLVAPQTRQRNDGTEHMLRSDGLLHLKASRASISRSGFKSDGSVTTGGARGIIAEVTLSES